MNDAGDYRGGMTGSVQLGAYAEGYRQGMAEAEAELARLRAEVDNARSILQYGRMGDRGALEVLGEMKAERDDALAEVKRLTKVYDETHAALRWLLPKPAVHETSLDDVPIGTLILRLHRRLDKLAGGGCH
jgi:hypothetical protein